MIRSLQTSMWFFLNLAVQGKRKGGSKRWFSYLQVICSFSQRNPGSVPLVKKIALFRSILCWVDKFPKPYDEHLLLRMSKDILWSSVTILAMIGWVWHDVTEFQRKPLAGYHCVVWPKFRKIKIQTSRNSILTLIRNKSRANGHLCQVLENWHWDSFKWWFGDGRSCILHSLLRVQHFQILLYTFKHIPPRLL
jgi:hypothetical protein